MRHTASYMTHCGSLCDENVGSPLLRTPAVKLCMYVCMYYAYTCKNISTQILLQKRVAAIMLSDDVIYEEKCLLTWRTW